MSHRLYRQKTTVGPTLSAEQIEKFAAKISKEDRELHKYDGVNAGSEKEIDFQKSFLPTSLIKLHKEINAEEDGSVMLPFAIEAECILMMADISGYTALSRSLCLLGPDGVDLLSMELNSFFDTLVTIVHAHGGDIYKFAGDAVICFWTLEEDELPREKILSRSIECSFRLIRINHPLLKVAEAVSSADSDFDVSGVSLPESLGLHCAIGVGTLEMAAVGTPPEFIANGNPFVQVEKALSASIRGELTISKEVWDAIDSDDKNAYIIEDRADGIKKLELVDKEGLKHKNISGSEKMSTRNNAFSTVGPVLWQQLLRFEPPMMRKEDQFDQNRDEHGSKSRTTVEPHHAFMITPQIRQVAIIFVNIEPNDSIVKSLLDLHPILSEMQDTMRKYNA